MRILLVTMQLGRSYNQGAERYAASLGTCLRQRGHDVAHLAGDPLHLDGRLPLGHLADGILQLYAYPTRGWMAVTGTPGRKLAPWLKQWRPDVVHLNSPAHIGVGIMDACRNLGIPVVVTVHDYWWICPKGTLLRPRGAICDGTPGGSECIRCIAVDQHRGWLRALARLPRIATPLLLLPYLARAAAAGMMPLDMLRWMRRRSVLQRYLDAARFVIFPSEAMCQVMEARLSHHRFRAIPNGLEASCFEDAKPAASGPRPASAMVIGFAGVLAPHKAPHLLLEAVQRLGWRQTKVRLAGAVGDPAYEQLLHRHAEGLDVEFVGRLSPDQMAGFLRSLDVLAITSVWPENYPYVTLEAQAAGVPVVGSRLGGLLEQIHNQRLLFEAGSVEGLMAALEYARLYPEDCRPPRVPTIEKMTDAVEGIYREALRPSPPAATND